MHAVKKVNWAQVQKAMPAIPEFSLNAYYRGGFESKMSKREAGLVLGKLCTTYLLRECIFAKVYLLLFYVYVDREFDHRSSCLMFILS